MGKLGLQVQKGIVITAHFDYGRAWAVKHKSTKVLEISNTEKKWGIP